MSMENNYNLINFKVREREAIERKVILTLIDLCLKSGNYTLTQFQLECLDFVEDVSSSIRYGKNDVEVSMEIWQDNEFYLKIDSKGNVLESR